jgi:hypothetical protein
MTKRTRKSAPATVQRGARRSPLRGHIERLIARHEAERDWERLTEARDDVFWQG